MDSKNLEKIAVEELLQEAKRGKERSSTMGPTGWRKNLIPTTNKRFLRKTIESSLHSHQAASDLSKYQNSKCKPSNDDDVMSPRKEKKTSEKKANRVKPYDANRKSNDSKLVQDQKKKTKRKT